MQFINIAGAASLTGAGLGCLAASAVLWRRAGVDLSVIARTLQALNA